jgi:hypothetical protein
MIDSVAMPTSHPILSHRPTGGFFLPRHWRPGEGKFSDHSPFHAHRKIGINSCTQ